MDESLEFQEKKSFKGPKNAKTTATKPKVKKVKRIKGQKDIRTALKPKKSDLITYSKDFDLVCKKSGIDVDSEQLQLAIALSKSLQPSESDDGPSTSTLTTQQRTGLIRSTLKEYGFKVPEGKIINNRKIKKRRKPYKLLITAHEEKEQIIADRYSQLLFELNGSNSKSVHDYLNVDLSDLFIYNMSTNIKYKDIQDDDVFYVEDLIEKSPNTMGCLLKKWSDIPGRQQSPTQDKSEVIFSEIECSQDEIDMVLSGSLKTSKNILNKRNLYKRKSIDCSIINEDIDKDYQAHVAEEKCNTSPTIEIVSSGENTSKTKENPVKVIDVPDKPLLSVPQTCRSLSPDLFGDDDDEVTIVETFSEPVKLVSNVITETTVAMDLTECVNAASQRCVDNSLTIKPLSQLSQEKDKTKRKSNDFMEITECVGGFQPILEKIDGHIDLTADPCNNLVTEENNVNIDQVDHMDLTQSSNTSTDSLPFVFISGKDKDPVTSKSLNDTIILDEKDYVVTTSPIVNNDENIVDGVNDKFESHSSQCKNIPKFDIIVKSPMKSSIGVKESSIICLDESHEVIEKDNIDLTQTSDTKEQNMDSSTVNTEIKGVNNSCLGKKDNISVDYDEALENMNSNSYCAYDITFDGANSAEADNNLENVQETKSVHSEVLELSDNEIDIPKKTKVDNHFDLGGISVIDHLPSFNSKLRNTMDNVPNGSIMSESLPLVYVKSVSSPVKAKSPFNESSGPVLDPVNDKESNTNDENKTEPKQASKQQTPVKAAEKRVNVETPRQTEYIVKTDNVTPMVDYAAMTSPERNRELDKYGLKPFKRKRAIQLLTHLYNQTHPYVESTEDLPSPSKKRKRDNLSQPSTSKSPRKTSKSPRSTSKSPRKLLEDSGDSNVSDKQNDMFIVTRETPVVRRIECDADDWVFQKREKAKVHTCRLPLHIAFHNFVSCRRRLHEAILRYEPVRIDVMHRELAASGHRYDPKDLLKFMDKKCITVKTADNAKNKNRY